MLPAYEKDIDHAGFLKSIDAKSFKRGEAIYLRVCANCHGTKDQVGSMPTSLRFAEGKFKNGADPFRMYQTLTHGYAVMTPQAWMVPEQKYDVIHYIQSEFVAKNKAVTLPKVTPDYLASLPREGKCECHKLSLACLCGHSVHLQAVNITLAPMVQT